MVDVQTWQTQLTGSGLFALKPIMMRHPALAHSLMMTGKASDLIPVPLQPTIRNNSQQRQVAGLDK